jgi:hypothetical protein
MEKKDSNPSLVLFLSIVGMFAFGGLFKYLQDSMGRLPFFIAMALLSFLSYILINKWKDAPIYPAFFLTGGAFALAIFLLTGTMNLLYVIFYNVF